MQRGATTVAVIACEHRHAAADLLERTGTGNIAFQHDRSRTIDDELPIVLDIGGKRAIFAAIPQLQCAGGYSEATAILISAGKNECTGARLLQLSLAPHHAVEGHRIGTIEGQRAVIEHVTGDGTGRTAIADLQAPGCNRRRAGIVVAAGQDGCASSNLLHPTRTADRACISHRVGAVEGKDAVILDIALD